MNGSMKGNNNIRKNIRQKTIITHSSDLKAISNSQLLSETSTVKKKYSSKSIKPTELERENFERSNSKNSKNLDETSKKISYPSMSKCIDNILFNFSFKCKENNNTAF